MRLGLGQGLLVSILWPNQRNSCACGLSKYHAWTSRPALHEFGANFPLLGIFEHPVALAKHRIRQTKVDEVQVATFHAAAPVLEYWTDGSLLWQKHFWVATAAFAIIDAAGEVTMSGPVFELTLSSYVPEL